MKKINMQSMGGILAVIGLFSCNVIYSADDKGKGKEVARQEYPGSFHIATALASVRGALQDGYLEQEIQKEVSERRGSIPWNSNTVPETFPEAVWGQLHAERGEREERYKETQEKTKIALKNNALQRLEQVGIEGVDILERIFESTKAKDGRASAVLDITAFKDQSGDVHVAVFRELFDVEGRVTNESGYTSDFLTGLVAVIAEGTMYIRAVKPHKTAGRPRTNNSGPELTKRDYYDDGLRAINGFMEGLHRNRGVIPSTIVGYRTGGKCVLEWLTDKDIHRVIGMGGFLHNWNYTYQKKFKNTKIITIDTDIKHQEGSRQIIHQPISTKNDT